MMCFGLSMSVPSWVPLLGGPPIIVFRVRWGLCCYFLLAILLFVPSGCSAFTLWGWGARVARSSCA